MADPVLMVAVDADGSVTSTLPLGRFHPAAYDLAYQRLAHSMPWPLDPGRCVATLSTGIRCGSHPTHAPEDPRPPLILCGRHAREQRDYWRDYEQSLREKAPRA